MSDTYRRYRAIKRALTQCLGTLQGHQARHLHTLVALIRGIVGSRHTHLPQIANHAPGSGAVQKSVIMRFRRWLQNNHISVEQWMLPMAQALLQALAHQPLFLVMDGSTVGRGCLALMVSVFYGNRALPLAWVVVKQRKVHLPQEVHRTLLAQVHALLPADATVIFLGDGEFDDTDLQANMCQFGWHYVCRTAPNILVTTFGYPFAIGNVPLAPDGGWYLPNAQMTETQYGPVTLLGVWESKYTSPLYLMTNLADPDQALTYYRRRAHIETFFSDQKSQGFHVHASHISAPQRLARLLIASCLAYIMDYPMCNFL